MTAAQPHTPSPVDLAAESVAGEEDPGASVEIALEQAPHAPGKGEQQLGSGMTPTSPQAPADQSASPPPLCPRCGGSGRMNGVACIECGGTGRLVAPGGGA